MPNLRRRVRLVLICIVTIVIAFAAVVASLIFRDRLAQAVAASSPIRWWRCYGSERPLLAQGAPRWEVEYQWQGGFGPGDVTVRIRNDGSASLQGEPLGSPHVARFAALSRAAVDRLARRIDETGLLCQSPKPRSGYRIADIGRFSLTVRSGSYEKTVFIDECNDLPDPTAFEDALEAVQDLKKVLGKEVAWGPFGAAYVQGTCSPEELAR